MFFAGTVEVYRALHAAYRKTVYEISYCVRRKGPTKLSANRKRAPSAAQLALIPSAQTAP